MVLGCGTDHSFGVLLLYIEKTGNLNVSYCILQISVLVQISVRFVIARVIKSVLRFLTTQYVEGTAALEHATLLE